MHQGLTQIQVEKLLTHTTSCINHIFHFEQDLGLKTKSSQRGTAIAFTDLKERRQDFIKELVHTVCDWVYSQENIAEIVSKRQNEVGGSVGNASSYLIEAAMNKFRPGHTQGQFGELLLFNFIQHFLRAAPLLRKQRITTNTGLERHGADAIHYRKENDQNILYLGESKCYESKYKFNDAFKAAIESIISTHNSLESELDLYINEEFIEKDLQSIADAYKANTLINVRHELVCLIAYHETKDRPGTDQSSIQQSIKAIIEERCHEIPQGHYGGFEQRILERIHYIIMPIWDLPQLMDTFQSFVGSA